MRPVCQLSGEGRVGVRWDVVLTPEVLCEAGVSALWGRQG